MVSGQDTGQDPLADAETITAVAGKALLFGEFSAKAVGADTFEDPVMHTYFLHYIFGAIEGLSVHGSLAAPLNEDGRVNAMGQALMTFEGSTREDVTGTLKMLFRARDEAAPENLLAAEQALTAAYAAATAFSRASCRSSAARWRSDTPRLNSARCARKSRKSIRYWSATMPPRSTLKSTLA